MENLQCFSLVITGAESLKKGQINKTIFQLKFHAIKNKNYKVEAIGNGVIYVKESELRSHL